jgi:hypothetical protein
MIIINNPSNNSVLPNSVLINGVAQINQSALPATRPDGSALVLGDKWYKTSDFTNWLWNGTYWVSKDIHDVKQVGFSSVGIFNYGHLHFLHSSVYRVFIESASYSFRSTNTSASPTGYIKGGIQNVGANPDAGAALTFVNLPFDSCTSIYTLQRKKQIIQSPATTGTGTTLSPSDLIVFVMSCSYGNLSIDRFTLSLNYRLLHP